MTITLFTAGAFGDAVARQLAAEALASEDLTLRVVPLVADAEVVASQLAGTSFAGVAAWRRCAAECDVLDAACTAAGIPWSSAVLEDATLVSGPLVSVGGPCYACYRRRWATHVRELDREQALDQAYAADSDLGVEGFLPSTVALAVAGLQLDRAQHGSAPGRLRSVDLLSGSFTETRVVPVHGCPRCSTTRPMERFVEHLEPAVQALLG